MAEAAEVLEFEEPPQEAVELDIEPDEQPEPPISYDETAANIVADLMNTKKGKEWVKKCADRVFREVDETIDAQKPYREKRADEWLFFNGDLPPKSWPWENCSNPHLPIYQVRALRLVYRIFGEAFGDFSEVANVLPVGPDDNEAAEMRTRYLNYQIQTQLLDFPRQMERGLMLFICVGDYTCHTFWDSFRKKIRHEVLTTDEFVVPYVHSTTEPDYSDCPWVAKILKMQRHEMQRMRDTWHDVDRILDQKPDFDDEPDSPLEKTQAEMQGIEPEKEGRAPYKLIHYEGWLDLPNSVDERFCKVVMEWRSKAVLQIQVMEEDDARDRQRYQRQEQELGQFRMDMQAFQTAAMQPPPMPAMDAMTGQPIPAPPPPQPPQAPAWADPVNLLDPEFKPDPVRRVPIHMFTHGVCVEPITGPLGVGYGKWLSDFNRAANMALAQFTDSATLANVSSFLSAGGRIEKPIEIQPGKITPIKDLSPKELQEALLELKFSPANPQLLDVVKMMESAADEATQAPGVLSGEAGKSGETAQGLNTRLEQATKQVSVTGRKYVRSVEQILRNHCKLLAQFMPEEEFFFVNNHKVGPTAGDLLKIGRANFDQDARVIIKSGMRFQSQAQRIAEADQILQMPTMVPALQVNYAFTEAATKRSLQVRDADDMLGTLGAAAPVPAQFGMPSYPPPPPPPPGADPNAQVDPNAPPQQTPPPAQ